MYPSLRSLQCYAPYLLCALLASTLVLLSTTPLLAQTFSGEVVEASNPEPFGYFGGSLAVLNDVNSDGTPDFAVGAYRETVGGVAQAGRVYWLSGADRSVILAVSAPTVVSGGAFGVSLDNAGDVDGDGKDDLLVGAFSPAAYVLTSADGTVLRTLARPLGAGIFGRDVATLGDTNGDGVNDYAVGAPGTTASGLASAGKAYVYSGANGVLLYELQSPTPEELGNFARRLTGIADVTQDGVSDLVVGAYLEDAGGTTNAGRVYVFSGANGQLVATLSSPNLEMGGEFGWEQADAGDVDGDGFADLLVGARGEQRAYVYSVADAQLIRALLPSGGSYFPSEFGRQVSAVGDLDGDGVSDHLISTLAEVYLYSGADGASLTVLQPTAGNPLNQFYGSETASIDELNGDRVPDLLVGAFGADVEGIDDAGAVYVYETVPPVLEVTPDTVDFGVVPLYTMADPETVTLTNTGGVFLTIDDVWLRQNAIQQFRLQAPELPFVLTPGASAELMAGFRPRRREARGRIGIASSDPAAPLQIVLLRGEASRDAAAQAAPVEVGASAPVAAPLTAYPNPLHREAEIRFGLADASPVRVTVYDVLGRTVALLANVPMEAGTHSLRLDAQNLPAGVYFVRLDASGRTETLRLAVRH